MTSNTHQTLAKPFYQPGFSYSRKLGVHYSGQQHGAMPQNDFIRGEGIVSPHHQKFNPGYSRRITKLWSISHFTGCNWQKGTPLPFC